MARRIAAKTRQIYDARREAYLRSQSWRILRVTNDAVYDCLDRVVEVILEHSRMGT